MGEARVDVPMGCVPDYRTFVRHVWSYRDEEGSCISGPPWVYRCIFESEEADVAEQNASNVAEMSGRGRLEVVRLPTSHREVRFADMEVLHLYLVSLAGIACEDDVARTIGEFLMWTLGFRWV